MNYVGAIVMLGILAVSAPAGAVTINFTGVTGVCKSAAPGCGPFQVGVADGIAYSGSFQYTGFTRPDDQTGKAADVTGFTVTFQTAVPITLTSSDAALIIHQFDAAEQWAAVVGQIDGTQGFFALGLQTNEPGRHDLLNDTGVQWNCDQWEFCGFEIAVGRLARPSFRSYPTAVNSFESVRNGSNGQIDFTEVSATPTPEPGTLWLLGGAALVGLAVYRGRQR